MKRTISFSQINTFLKCQKRYFWEYVLRLEPPQKAQAFIDGGDFAEGMELLTDDSEATLPQDSPFHQIAKMAREHWAPRPGEKPEQEFRYDVNRHFDLVGIADAVSDDAVIEYKTTARATNTTWYALSLSLQHRLYALFFDKPNYLLRVVKKSQIRQRTKRDPETKEQFVERLISLYRDNPQEYFLEVQLYPEKQGALTEVRVVCDNIIANIDRDTWPRSAPYACQGMGTCPFLDLCRDYETYKYIYKEKGKSND